MVDGPTEEEDESSSQWRNVQNSLAAIQVARQAIFSIQIPADPAILQIRRLHRGFMQARRNSNRTGHELSTSRICKEQLRKRSRAKSLERDEVIVIKA